MRVKTVAGVATAVLAAAVQGQTGAEIKEIKPAAVEADLTLKTNDAVETIGMASEKSGDASLAGGKISLSLKGVELTSVVRLFAELSQVNIILPELGPEVAAAKVDVNLKDVEWKPALQAILDTHNLELYEKITGSDVYSVRTKLPPEAAPQNTQTFVFNHADITAASEMIRGIVGARGQVYSYPQGNAVVVKATQEVIDDVAQVAERIDQPRQQVLIDSRIFELSDSNNKARGMEFSWSNILTGDPNAANNGPASGDLLFDALQAVAGDYAAGAPGALTLNSADFDLTLKAIQTSGKARIVSSPKVIVANGETADIQILQKIPRIEVTRTVEQNENGQPTASYQATQETDGEDKNTGRKRYAEYEFGIRLAVTPTVYTEDNIAVKMVPIISRRNKEEDITIELGQGLKNQFYAVEEKRVETTFMLGNKRTAVIGGLTESQDQEFERKIPLLGNIPVIRHLFTYKDNETVQKENIIFVTVSLEDGKEFDVAKAVKQSPLTRKQMIRDDNNQIIEDHAVEAFKAHEDLRIEESNIKTDRNEEAVANERKMRKPFWKILRP